MRLAAFGLAAVLVVSCTSTTEPDLAQLEATVEFVSVEGGCWRLVTDQGIGYEPVNLPESFRSDGLQVDVTVRLRKDLGSICQVGQIVDIESIRVRP